MKYSQIIDISIPLSPATIVYPGNPPIEIEEVRSEASKSIISKITSGSHNGTHIDAPRHAILGGASITDLPLDVFMGPCRVIDCTGDTESVTRATLESNNIQSGERILLKTPNSLRGYDVFYEDFVFLSPEGAQYLSEVEIALVGIDYLSIKQKGSADNRPHTVLLEKNIPIIEGIDLSQVEPGEYTLVAFPLKYVGLDGAPARVVLLG
ncbi:cyclase family protein [Candidatus Woesebacteria bacterium]|nr:cyclase family protein [Candidatus Woesebacteria bacterium]